MRKTILYLTVLLVLITSIYYFLFYKNDGQYNSAEAGFTIKDTASIGKLFLVSNNGESILAERTDSGWMVNKQYHALPSTLNLVLTTLNTQSALYPITRNAYENAIKTLATDAIKLEIYGRDNQKMKTIYIGGSAVNNAGTNMLIDGASTPYVVQVPGFNGYLTSRFSTNIRDWRDRTVFDVAAADIQKVSVEYPGEKSINSFEIVRENGKLVVKGDSNITKNLDTLNTHRAGLYLGYFSNINCEGFLNGLPDNDTTIKTAPKQSSIDLTTTKGKHQHIDIYWMALNKRSKNISTSEPDVPDDYDADRLYAVINNYKDTVMIQRFVFGKIFRKSFEFFQRDAPRPAPTNPKELPQDMLLKKGK